MQIRKRFRFSLRTFLVATTLLAIWLAFYLHQVQKQKASVAGILDYGGWVYYDFHFPTGEFDPHAGDLDRLPPTPTWLVKNLGVDWFHDVVAVNLSYGPRDGKTIINPNYNDECMPHLAGLPDLRMLTLDYGQASSETMSFLANASSLEYLQMSGSKIGDQGVAHLDRLKQLRSVTIDDGALTDDSMRIFARCPVLTVLVIRGENQLSNKSLQLLEKQTKLIELNLNGRGNTIDDEGLKYLAHMGELKKLALEGSQITNEGLRQFARLPKLRQLEVGYTEITWRGADEWKKTLDRSVQFQGHALP